MPKVHPTVSRTNWPDTMADLSMALIADYHLLRAGKISVLQARARAKLADAALRTISLQFMGVKYLTEQAKSLPNPGRG
jgi:hypothetical protein